MKKETLEKEYLNNKLTYQEIGDKYDICVNTVWYYMKKYEISPLKPYERLDIPEWTDNQRDFMIGTMLGDGCLRVMRAGNDAYLDVKHSLKQKEYVEWKYSLLKGYVNSNIKIFTDSYKGKQYEKCRFTTICHPIFTDYYKMFYDSGIKVVTNEVADALTPMSLAVWFMDDGCGNINNFELCTESFTEPELKRLQLVLSKKFKLVTSLWFERYRKGSNQKMFKLAILKRSADTFTDIIKPCIIPSMMYKLRFRLLGTPEAIREAPQIVGEDMVHTLE